MVRIAVRTLSLNVYKVEDLAMRKFILDRSAVPYFSNLVWFLRDQTLHLSEIIEKSNYLNLPKLEEFVENLLDLFYYLQDIMNLGIEELSATLIDQLLSHYVLPVLIGSLTGKFEPKIKMATAAVSGSAQTVTGQLAMPLNSAASSGAGLAQLATAPVFRERSSVSVSAPRSPLLQPQTPNSPPPMALNQNQNANATPNSALPLSSPPLSPGVSTISSTGLLSSPAPRDPLIQTRLSLFLLSQLFQCFSHYAFLNAVSTSLLHPHPPLLSETLICNPPQFPVKGPLPIASILFPKLAGQQIHSSTGRSLNVSPNPDNPQHNNSSEEEKNSVAPRQSSSTVSDPSIESRIASETASEVEAESEVGDARVDESMSSKGREKTRVSDQNLKARSQLPDVGPLISPIQSCPNYSQPAQKNIYRQALLASLSSLDEREILGAIGVLWSVTQNEAIDKEILSAANILPQRLRKARKLFDELTDEGGLFGETKSIKPTINNPANEIDQSSFFSSPSLIPASSSPYVQPPVSIPSFDLLTLSRGSTSHEEFDESEEQQNLLVLTSETPKQTHDKPQAQHAIEESQIGKSAQTIEAAEHSLDHSRDEDPLMNRAVKPRSNPSSPPIKSVSSPVINTISSLSIPSISIPSPLSFDYAFELVDRLLPLVHQRPPPRLVSHQLMAEFLTELVFHSSNSAPCLAPTHSESLEAAYLLSVTDMKTRFQSQFGYLMLDLIEDEWQLLSKSVVAKKILSNPINLLTIEENPISGIPLEYRKPNGELEKTRVFVQLFILLRILKYKMTRKKDPLFPLGSHDSQMKVDEEISIAGTQESIACTLAVGPKKINLFLVLDQQSLLLVIRHPAKVGFAKVQMIVSLRHQEPFLNRNNSSVLHITIRSVIRPHPSCRRLKGGSADAVQAPLWNLTLLFADSVQCASAKRHLESSRLRLRKLMLNRIFKSFDGKELDSADAKELDASASSAELDLKVGNSENFLQDFDLENSSESAAEVSQQQIVPVETDQSQSQSQSQANSDTTAMQQVLALDLLS